MSPELQPMAMHYYCDVSVSRDQYTALPLVGVLMTCSGRKNNIFNNIY